MSAVLLRYVDVLREHARLVRRGEAPRHFDRRRVVEGLKVASAALVLIRSLRAHAEDPFAAGDPRADCGAALLVGFAAAWRSFGAGATAVIAIDAVVRAQLQREGWELRVTPGALVPITVEVMTAAAGGLPIDFLGIAAALAAGLGAPGVVHDVAGAGYVARRPRGAYAGSDHASLRADFSME